MSTSYPIQARTVLIVDDEEAVRDSLSELLAGFGYRVVLAEDASSALKALDCEKPDVVLTDIYMSTGDGYELISALRQQSRAVRVVAMSSGHASYDPLKVALHLGADAVIDKPFPSAGLIETIDRQFI
jgi:CheY-like chemotaxis protein